MFHHTATCSHTRIATGGVYMYASDAVDIYNAQMQSWSIARLSVARSDLAAASVGNFAVFAGGWTGIAWL
jgi:hypothetical protein